jgi:hypothetical protein
MVCAAIVPLFLYTVSSFSHQNSIGAPRDLLNSDSSSEVAKLIHAPEDDLKKQEYCPVDKSLRKRMRQLLREIGTLTRTRFRQRSRRRKQRQRRRKRIQRRQTVSEISKENSDQLVFLTV